MKITDGQKFVIAIDGYCASGKSTLAELLGQRLGAGVIHMDDFFLPKELRTQDRLSQPGGNVHYERFLEEVIPRLDMQQNFAYQRFDCSTMALGEYRQVKSKGIYVVEGAYSCHPVLKDYMDYKIFTHVERDVQLARILQRSGPVALENFKKRWIPMEEAYFNAYEIRNKADLILDTTFLDSEKLVEMILVQLQ